MKLGYDVGLGSMNTFRMNVKTACLAEYDSFGELESFFSDERLSGELPLPFYHIGGGSNLLFTGDFSGTILHSRIKFIEMVEENLVHVGAGVVWDDFCEWCAGRGLWGPENLSLIPGEVGAAAVQNIGAYGREAKDIIVEVECYDIVNNCRAIIKNKDCHYAYRDSIFKNEGKGRYIVTSVLFRLSSDYNPELGYGHVKEAAIEDYGIGTVESRALTPSQIRNLIIDIRKSKLPDPDVIGSAGSFFRNPFVSAEQYSYVEFVAEKENLGSVPHFVMDSGLVKIPAAWLIEKCGWKGYKRGNVGVYENQPLVLINFTGKALPEELIKLENDIRTSVSEHFGITLFPEVEHI